MSAKNTAIAEVRQIEEQMGHGSWRLPVDESAGSLVTAKKQLAAMAADLREGLAHCSQKDRAGVIASLESIGQRAAEARKSLGE